LESRPARLAQLAEVATKAPAQQDTLVDRFLAVRDRIYASPTFHQWAARIPVIRWVARSRAQALFDITAGFVYSQTLAACTRLDLFRKLSAAPMTPSEIAVDANLPIDSVERLIEAATALELFSPRSGGRIGLGALGGPILAQDAIVRMVSHNALLYTDLADPLALLTRTTGSSSAVGQFFPYAETAAPQTLSPTTVAAYSELMAQTVAPIAHEVLDSGILDGRRCLLDVGGGQGAFLFEVAERYQKVRLRLFDLPAVVQRAASRIEANGLGDRFECLGGDFHNDPLPEGADAISLVRVLLDHDDRKVLALLRRVRAALPKGGALIVAEPMTDVSGARRVGEVYFSFYLRAMGRGRCRSTKELNALVREAGFRRSRILSTRYPVFASILVADA
jgi:demethylspheroidene O-methyltransferase